VIANILLAPYPI